MNIRVDLNYPIKDGTEVVFRSPVDCSQVTGLKVYFPGGSQEFAFADAHGNNVGDIDHLFAENVAVKVILDVTTGMAFVQNADTNAYLERRFGKIEEILDAHGSFKLLETITLEEETNRVSVGFDKKYKAVRARVEFPSKTTSNGYVYSKVKMFADGQPGNMCGSNMPVGTVCVDLFRIASEYTPVAVFSCAEMCNNEYAAAMKFSFPNPANIAFNEKDGFAGFEVNTYAINFPAGTVIRIMGG